MVLAASPRPRFRRLTASSVVAGRALAALIAGAIAIDGGGCGSSGDRPNALGDFGTADASVDGSQTFQSSGPVPLSCNLGPDGGVCACDDQPLLGDPPNLYLILDRSGSMSTDGKWSTVADVIEKLVIDLGPRAVVGVTVFPDPYSDDTCAPGAEIYPPTRGDAPAGQAGSSEVRLVKTLADILANGGTPTAATIEAVTPRIRGLSGKTYVILATDGGPNCNPDATCDASQCELNIESPNTPIQSICPPGGPPNCCADPAYGDATSCLDAQPTIDAVTALASDGIPVYIVGVPGSAPYAALLNQLAIAGNTARVPPADAGVDGGAGAVDGATQYYDVQTTDQSAFESAIFSIAAAITGTCTLTLSAVPPDPSQVNVFLDEQVLPQQGADGWTLDGQTVTLLGQSCAKVKAGDVLDVRVVAGCPTLQR